MNDKILTGGGKLTTSAESLVNYLIKSGHNISLNEKDTIATLSLRSGNVVFNMSTNKYEVPSIKYGRSQIFDLRKEENHSVVMLLIALMSKGYSLSNIYLEKSWQTGHDPVFLDLMLQNEGNSDIYMIEVKTNSEYRKYTNPNNEKKTKQLFSYAMQESRTKVVSFYTYDFEHDTPLFSTVFCEDLRRQSRNSDDFYERWNKIFDHSDWISENDIFNARKQLINYHKLQNIRQSDTDLLFKQFETVLRLNSISDKPTAFMKMINLFLAKLADEITEDKQFLYKDKSGNIVECLGMKFQYIDNETPESFMKRLNDLYKEGMSKYLNTDIIDYSDSDIDKVLSGSNHISELKEIIENLRLKKDVNFSFIDVYDDRTFHENFYVVKDMVSLIENFRLKYETKHQFLGDFFEELLNTSLKQEAGQFFTPYPMVDFMVHSLDIKERITKMIEHGERDFIPAAIDYACGAGHFLISYMTEIQKTIKGIDDNKCTSSQEKAIKSFRDNPYSWVNKTNVIGIEKDYRLAKTTKIASFLNGDGDANIIAGDGINKFSCREYLSSVLYLENGNKREIFDYVISNPPYSVEGFMLNFQRNGISKDSNTFSLLDTGINPKDTAIEIYFVERMEQLLKHDGLAAIILPQSILSGEKYGKMRKFLFSNFRILALLLTADITFSGTTTSPVVLFLRKEKVNTINYDILIHQSPKYSSPNAAKMKQKEIDFLGYEFSSDRNKPNTIIKETSVLSELSSITRDFILHGHTEIPEHLNQFSQIRNIGEILLNAAGSYPGDLYPKRIVSDGLAVSNFCKINEYSENDFSKIPTDYLEIGDMQTQIPQKRKTTKRYCKSGDILVSSLTPRASQIVIAKGDFMLTSAIHVLSSFKTPKIRDAVYSALKSRESLSQMNALLDGFKVTYAKISETNLYNNINIQVE